MRDDELKKLKKKFVAKLVITGIVILALVAFFGVFSVNRVNVQREREKKEKEQRKIVEKELIFQYKYKGLYHLTFLKNKEDKEKVQVAFESLVKSSLIYGVFTTDQINEAESVEVENNLVRFYLSLDNQDSSIIEGVYDGSDYTFGYYGSGKEVDEVEEQEDEEEIDLDIVDALPVEK